jgi:hypothetical protein
MLVPEQLSLFHCPDFRTTRPYTEALDEIVRILGKAVPPLATLFGVDALPPHFMRVRMPWIICGKRFWRMCFNRP